MPSGAESRCKERQDPVNPLHWLGAHLLPSFRVPHHLLLPTDQRVDPLGGLGLGPGRRRGCRSDRAGLDTAMRTDGGSEEQQGSGRN